MTFNVHEVADCNNDLLDLLSKLTGRGKDQSLASFDIGVELLQDRDGEGCGLPGTRLSLRNDIGTWKLRSEHISSSGNSAAAHL